MNNKQFHAALMAYNDEINGEDVVSVEISVESDHLVISTVWGTGGQNYDSNKVKAYPDGTISEIA